VKNFSILYVWGPPPQPRAAFVPQGLRVLIYTTVSKIHWGGCKILPHEPMCRMVTIHSIWKTRWLLPEKQLDCTHDRNAVFGGLRLKYDGAGAETRFRLSAKRTSPFKSAGGRRFSRLLTAEVCASAVVMLDTPCSKVVWRVLATHSIRQFRLHFPFRASPCAITLQLESTTWYTDVKCDTRNSYVNTPTSGMTR